MQQEFHATLRQVAKQLFDAIYGVGISPAVRDWAFKSLGELEESCQHGDEDALFIVSWYQRLEADWQDEMDKYDAELDYGIEL